MCLFQFWFPQCVCLAVGLLGWTISSSSHFYFLPPTRHANLDALIPYHSPCPSCAIYSSLPESHWWLWHPRVPCLSSDPRQSLSKAQVPKNHPFCRDPMSQHILAIPLGKSLLSLFVSHHLSLHLLFGRKATTNLDSIWKSRDITLQTKVRIVKAMVFPIVVNRCESWTIKKAEHWRIGTFELWCWRRLLRVPGLQEDPTSPV